MVNKIVKNIKFYRRWLPLKLGIVITKDLVYLGRQRNIKALMRDYVRASSLELISYEIYQRKIPGNVAEVGVYQGDFAMLINLFFPDRKLYLFDTFQGFPEEHTQIDRIKNYSKADQYWGDTSIELVMSKMVYKENIIIRKGVFPETAMDIQDSFCFVSIDVDLYEPTKLALEFFYPKLNKGGYIFVHDFNNSGYKGVRSAVLEFSEKFSVPYFPLSDGCGTAVLMK
jgi:O-methyltransferase